MVQRSARFHFIEVLMLWDLKTLLTQRFNRSIYLLSLRLRGWSLVPAFTGTASIFKSMILQVLARLLKFLSLNHISSQADGL